MPWPRIRSSYPSSGNNYILQFTTSRVYGVFSWSVGGVSGTIGARVWTPTFNSFGPSVHGHEHGAGQLRAATDSDGFCLTLVEVFEQTHGTSSLRYWRAGWWWRTSRRTPMPRRSPSAGGVIFDSDLEEVSSCFTVRHRDVR